MTTICVRGNGFRRNSLSDLRITCKNRGETTQQKVCKQRNEKLYDDYDHLDTAEFPELYIQDYFRDDINQDKEKRDKKTGSCPDQQRELGFSREVLKITHNEEKKSQNR
jgi:hypothetical protein